MFLVLTLAATVIALFAMVRWLEPRLAFFPSPGEDGTPRDFGIPFEAVTVTTADGERLRAWRMTPPTPIAVRARILYFHGNGGNLSNWAPVLAGVVRRGYAVFALDYRGYGVSSGRPTERGLYRDVDAAVQAAWPAGETATPIVFWGRSLGGAMAAYAASVRPPDGIVVESGFPDARAVLRGTPLALLSWISTYRFPAAQFLARTEAPVLVIHGDRDSVIPFALGRELFEGLRPPKDFVVIPGGDHNDAAPPDPAAYWTAIDSFIQRLPRRHP